MKPSLATEMAPPFILVAHFFIAGIVFLSLSGVGLLSMSADSLGSFLSLSLAAFSHLYLLGFVMMIIFGAMYQLLPVVLEAPIFSKDFAYVQFYMYVIGVALMVSGFSVSTLHLLIPYGAVITYLSMAIFCVNVFMTFYRLEKIRLIGWFLLIATLFLFVSVTLGLLIGLTLEHGLLEIDIDAWVKAHIIGTLGGFVMMIVMGVSMVLIPMFSLSHGFSDMWIKRALSVYTLGIALGMATFVFGLDNFFKFTALALMFLGMAFYLIQMVIVMRQRVRKQNDYWVKNSVFAWVSLSVSMLSVSVYALKGEEKFAMLFGVFFFFGFLLSFIVGHIYKILPFLIWYEKFSPLVGKQKVPLLHQMVHTKTANTQTYSLWLAVILQASGILMQEQKVFFYGSVILLLSLVLVAFNAMYAFNFKIKENEK
ncbi:hypothetical protein [Sulfurospirillum barnesii]|uniref:Cytochrome C and Quinol oxidase polypeptide I n=1 Tax=Sulfurospirillum barnesii (strain ATCC 700032 / DSM 10660 / SES-3) TaxID=760154 RepID=I3XXW5_SULBS|nr:hypothetical protein [Sulfurospirillum barnesii]AFL68789.1 hypothetical protein Sulba_1501 [Sulfurospirillum barnesii SES-3]